jgi:precorrin-6B methylase 2
MSDEVRKESEDSEKALAVQKREITGVDSELTALRRHESTKKQFWEKEISVLHTETQIVLNTFDNDLHEHAKLIENASVSTESVISQLNEHFAKETRTLIASHAESKASRLEALEHLKAWRPR